MSKRRFGKVRQLPSGRWQARYLAPEGGERSGPQTFATKTDASVWLSTVEADIARGLYRDPAAGRAMFAAWSRKYLDARAATLKPSTVASYGSLYTSCLLPTFDEVRIGNIRRSDVRGMVAALTARGLGPSRVRKALVLLSLILEAAVDDNLIESNVARGVQAPRLPEHEPRILTPADVLTLRDEIRVPYGVLVDVLAYCGVRLGEALALRRRHIDFMRGLLLVRESVSEISGRHHFGTPKTHQTRDVTLPAFLAVELSEYLADCVPLDPDSLLFTGRTGKALHYTTLRRNIWDPAVKAAGLEGLTPHALRATCGTWTADELGVLAAAERLGHSRATVTAKHYARARKGVQDDAAVRLDGLRTAVPESQRARSGHDAPRVRQIRRPTGT